MRKKIALFLSLAVMLLALIPANVFAADDKGMENVLNVVKARITIPAEYSEFSYSVSTNDGKTTWNFSWSIKGSTDESPINVTADSNGNILNFYHYVPYDYNQQRLPKVDKQTAKANADEFLKRVYPDAAAKVKYVDNSQYTAINNDYSFNYIRMENNIPIPDNNINVNVSSKTGDVSSYYCNWTDGLTFPDAGKVLTMEAAQNAYKQELGLRLVYSWNHDTNNPKVFSEYVPVYNSNYFIDAITGKRIQLSQIYFGGAMGKGMANDMMVQSTSAASPAPLTPEEQKAVEEVSKLLSQDTAEKIARDFTELGLTSDFKLTNASLSKNWDIDKGYTWNLNFAKDNADNSKDVSYIGVSIDAITGEITGFNRYFPHNSDETAVYDENASKTAVDNFLKSFKADKYSNLEFDNSFDKNIYPMSDGKTAPTQYNFTYYRTVNGARFVDNSINIGFDAITGKITNMYMSWYDLTFPSVDKVLPVDTVYQKMFSDIGLELQYRFDYSQDAVSDSVIRPVPVTTNKPTPRLVYTVKQDKPLSFDANTGDIIDSNGQPYKEIKPPVYTDITGNFAEQQISILAANGIYLDGTEFKPNDSIKQVDFMRLIAKSLNYYGSIPDDSKSIDDMYKFLITSGVIKESEKAPDSYVTRLDAARFMVRTMKYDKVADIKGIFKCTFGDADKIGEDNIGYVAIVQGLKIMNGYGGAQPLFVPDGKLTRAEGAVIIYNYLQR